MESMWIGCLEMFSSDGFYLLETNFGKLVLVFTMTSALTLHTNSNSALCVCHFSHMLSLIV